MRMTMYLRCLIPPILVQMSLRSTRAGSSLQPCPLSPANDPHVPGSDGLEDEAVPAVWKRRYLALQESVNNQKSSKRKSE
jgi:hypothetical protein